jgi:hypothetical protein
VEEEVGVATSWLDSRGEGLAGRVALYPSSLAIPCLHIKKLCLYKRNLGLKIVLLLRGQIGLEQGFEERTVIGHFQVQQFVDDDLSTEGRGLAQ